MKDIVREYQEQFRRHRLQLRRYTALMLALAMVTTLFVNWQLHSDGIAKTADYQCGQEEHTHTADCYPQVLVCGYEEGEPEDWTVSQPDADMILDDSFGVDTGSDIAAESAEPEYIWVPHEHTDDCYAEVTTEVPVLTCMEEEHVHTNDCYDPEDNTLICEEFEHTHDESCYTMETETEEQLVCGYEEGELVEELNPDYNPVAMFEAPVSAAKPVVIAPVAEGPVHHHTDACYAPDYTADPICGMEEHHHDVNCLSDPLDGVDDESDWLDKTGTALTGVWNEDLLTVAQGQLGYEQSEKNFKLDTDDGETLRYYTRYGAWYGNSYGAGWDVMFLSYCLNHANIPQSAIPQESGAMALHSQLRGTEYMGDFSGGMPIDAVMPGDIVFYTAASTKAVVVEDSQPAVSDDSPEADIALLSMDEAAAASEAPQIEEVPFIGTTVGIVSDVDQDAGTLTVISGNVDGKVAEVTPDISQVTSLVSVATAQAVNEGGADTTEGNLNLDPKSDLDGSPYVLSFDLKVLKNGQYVTPDEYKLSETVHSMVSLKDIPASEIKSHNYQVYLKLPDSFKVPENTTGSLIDTLTNAESGRYTFQQDSAGNWYLVLNYNEDYIAADEVSEDSKVSSKVEFDFQWDESKIKKNEDNTISLPGHDMIIRINDDTQTDSNYSLDKTGSSLTYNGNDAFITYTVSFNVKQAMDGPLTLTDTLQNPAGASFDYVDNSLSISGTDAPKIDWKDGTGTSKTITIGESGKKIAAGTYDITYKVKCSNFGSKTFTLDDKVKNNIVSTDDDIHDSSSTEIKNEVISKSGSSSNGGKEIKWTVTINDGSSRYNLKNDKFTDTIPDGLTLKKDSLKIVKTDASGNKTTVVEKGVASSGTLTINGQEISYPLDDGFNKYEITYTTTVDDYENLPLDGKSFENTGKVSGDHNGSDSETVTVKPTVLKKKAVGDPSIDEENNEAILSWSTTIDIKGSLNGYIYYDYGERNRTDSNTMLQSFVEGSVQVTDADGKDVTADLQDGITAYISETKDDHGTDCGLFKIDFAQHNITGPVTITYKTKVDMTKLPENFNQAIVNHGKIEKDGKSAEDKDSQKISNKKETSKYLEKYVRTPGGSSGNDVSTSLQVGQKLSWEVVFNKESKLTGVKGDVVITDTIPEGMILDRSSVRLTNFYGTTPQEGTDYTIGIGTDESGRETITVTLKDSAYLKDGMVRNNLTLCYDTMLDPDKVDTIFDPSTGSTSHKFTNRATLKYNGTEGETFANVTVTREVLGKEGSFDEQSNVLSYTVKVNPTGADLSGGTDADSADYVILHDSFKIGDLKNKDKRVQLQSITVFEAERQDDGSLLSSKLVGDLLLDSNMKLSGKDAWKNAYSLTDGYYCKRVDSDGNIEVWAKLKNRQPYILIFNYSVNTENLELNKDFKLTNKVDLNGAWEVQDQTTSVKKTTSGTSAITNNGDRLQIIKYAGSNVSSVLKGAEFQLEAYNAETGDWERHEVQSGGKTVYTFTTSEKGQCIVPGLKRNTVYRVNETKAPEGYVANHEPYYFYIQSPGNEWTPPETLPGVTLNKFTADSDNNAQLFPYYCSNTRDPGYVEHGSLRVKKVWQNASGVIMDADTLSKLSSVQVQLTKHSKTATVTFVDNTNTPYATSVYTGGSVTVTGTWPTASFSVSPSTEQNATVTPTADGGVSVTNIKGDVVINVDTTLGSRFPAGNLNVVMGDPNAGEFTSVIGTVKLNTSDNWISHFENLEIGDGITYTIDEVSVDGYTASYTLNNEALEAGASFELGKNGGSGDTIVITNTADETGGYELPSTGGAGTTPYTAVGGAIALAALVCGLCQKRRRERRAQN